MTGALTSLVLSRTLLSCVTSCKRFIWGEGRQSTERESNSFPPFPPSHHNKASVQWVTPSLTPLSHLLLPS